MAKERKPKVTVERWYVEHRGPTSYTIRGPYKHSETAVAVRAELEHWGLNLVIVCREEKIDGKEA